METLLFIAFWYASGWLGWPFYKAAVLSIDDFTVGDLVFFATICLLGPLCAVATLVASAVDFLESDNTNKVLIKRKTK